MSTTMHSMSSEEQNTSSRRALKVCIVGAGIGGLICAIACRLEGISVHVLEQAAEILPIGAGIQVPPNATRVLDRLGILPQMLTAAREIATIKLRRYKDGALLACRPVKHQTPWLVIHRADYQEILLNRAKELGVQISLGVKVVDIDFRSGNVYTEDGRVFASDVAIGADGLWSETRATMLGHESSPTETGDLAYRATFTRKQLELMNDPRITELCNEHGINVWLGPGKHCVFYQIRGGEQMNMILLRPDNLAHGIRTQQGDIDEMRQTFQDWDDVLTKLISCIPTVLKWKLMHHSELESWTKGCVALLGDACHPTLPYQAQGAAMAVEDGAILGNMLGRLNHGMMSGAVSVNNLFSAISEVLRSYESCQKRRTTLNVQGAVDNRRFYHLDDGPTQEDRDDILAKHTWTDERSEYMWCDMAYNEKLLNIDVVADASEEVFSWAPLGGRL